MKRQVLLYIGALAIATMVGCAKPLTLSFNDRQVTPQQIDQLVAQEEYGEALDLFNLVPITHPQYALFQKKLADVKKRAAAYEKTVLKNMRAKIKKGNWSGAIDEVDTAIDKLPSSIALKQGREELLRKRAQRIDQLETEILITKGKWLAQDAPLHEQLSHVESQDVFDKWRTSRKKSEVEETAAELYECSERAMKDNNLEQARTCLTLAETLDASEKMKAAAKERRQEIAKREKQARKEKHKGDFERLATQAKQAMNKGQLRRSRRIVSQLAKIDPDNPEVQKLQQRLNSLKNKKRVRKEKRQQDYERLAKQAQEAMDKGELRKAQQIVPELVKIDPDNPEVQKLQQQLSETVSAKVDTMLKRGSQLYRKEKIAEAKKVWEEVLELDPSNKQAQAGVKRAERVLERLRLLEEKERPPAESNP
jgi:tetratricopeptide (TPR) repeat protein